MMPKPPSAGINPGMPHVDEGYPMKITLVPLFALALLSFFLSSSSSGQLLESGIGPSLAGASQAAYYYLSKPGEISIQVNLWGFVRNPGRYEVPISTDLVQLISFAGGPQQEADISSVKITRIVRDEAIRKVEFTINLRHLDQLDDQSLSLQPGDTIFIDSKSFSVAGAFNILATTAFVIAAIANVITAVK
jgi:hypothetical protein